MNTLTDIKIQKAMLKTKQHSLPKQLFISDIIFEHKHNIMAVFLRNGFVMSFSINEYPSLAKATEKQRNNWKLISGGTGVSWEDINEDLSVKGFIQSYIKITKSFINKNERILKFA